jgi:hypothetical protein
MDLAKRVEGVRLLLGSLNEPYPSLRGALRPDSGPALSRYLPCETCRSTGRVRGRGGYLVCLVCGGTGEKRREHGDLAWDAYMRLPLEEAVQLPQELGHRARALEPLEEEAYAWERRRAQQDRQGSYAELRRQLDWLRGAHPPRHHLVVVVLVEQLPREITPRAQLEVDLGVVSLALRMRVVRVPRWLREPQRRVETVSTLAALGLQAGEIARKLGMTKKAVRRQLKALDSGHAGVPARAT